MEDENPNTAPDPMKLPVWNNAIPGTLPRDYIGHERLRVPSNTKALIIVMALVMLLLLLTE